jgi:hypothetical protein
MNQTFRFAIVTTCLPVIILAWGCSKSNRWSGSLEEFLLSQPDRFGPVLDDPVRHRVQIIYTQIDRDESNQPSFTSFKYRVDADEYFYPASTVKLPTALVALEKINRLAVDGLTRDTPMITGTADPSQSPAVQDLTSDNGLPSVGHYIRKILLVSDNDAFNRLYEFIGQEPLNTSLKAKGYAGTRIMHRLESPLSLEENMKTNPVTFVQKNQVVHVQPAQLGEQKFVHSAPILLGKAELIGSELVNRPKDFAEKNSYPLQDMHDIILALIFPDAVPERRRFKLTEDDYRFVYRNMSSYPGDSGIVAYSDEDEYPDAFVKFLMYGGDARRIPHNIRIFNKVGDAYGFLTDAAYIIDLARGIEFILAATVYTNANETFNDNNYEYDEIGLPFLRELGQAIYELEAERNRARKPDLRRFTQLE